MKNVYLISLVDSKGKMQGFSLLASTMANAIKEACRRAGVSETTEPRTCQLAHTIDGETD